MVRGDQDDAALVDSARRGDAASFAELVRRHRRAVQTVIAGRIRSREDRLDVAQEVFARAFARLDSLAEPAAFRAWVIQIARNVAIDHLRRAGRTQVLSLDHPDAPQPVDPDPTPEDLAELAVLARRVRSGLALLSPREATALALSVHLGFGPAELAAALGVTPGNAKVILHRARRRLRAVMESDVAVVSR